MARLAPALRGLAAVVALIGLLCTLDAAALPARAPDHQAGYLVLAADFHVHSFPGDGALAPWDLAIEARRRHLDVIALTNHNSMHSWRLARWLAPLVASKAGAAILPGDELTAVGYHLTIVGAASAVDWRETASSAAASAHGAGAVAIAAHPGHWSWPALDDAALAVMDGVEVAHPMMMDSAAGKADLVAFARRARRVHPSIASIGSSDFHRLAPLGLCRTYLFVRASTLDGILEAIRSGRTVACDGRGETYGPPELAPLVRDACRSDATGPPDGDTSFSRTGTWLVWAGLLGLVLIGPEG